MAFTRVFVSALVLASLCVHVLAGPATPATNRQLLKNPGFEAGTHKQAGLGAIVPDHWYRDWRNVGTVKLVEDEGLAHSGKKLVRIVKASAYTTKSGLEPGMKYRVRAWMKGEGKASARIVFYLYKRTGKRKVPFKNVGAWTFAGPPTRLTETWTLYEKVYTAPEDRSVDSASVAVHAGGSVLVDDVTLRAWDGRPLNVRVASSPIFQERAKYEKILAKNPAIKKKRGAPLATVYEKAAALRDAAGKAKTLEAKEKAESDLEALLDEYAKLREEIQLDLGE